MANSANSRCKRETESEQGGRVIVVWENMPIRGEGSHVVCAHLFEKKIDAAKHGADKPECANAEDSELAGESRESTWASTRDSDCESHRSGRFVNVKVVNVSITRPLSQGGARERRLYRPPAKRRLTSVQFSNQCSMHTGMDVRAFRHGAAK